MRRPRHDLLPDEDLQPTFVPAGEDRELRAAYMRELRALSNAIAESYHARDQLLLRLAASQTLSRRDMATACRLAKSRVDQIISELAQAEQNRRNAVGLERVRRHTPPQSGASGRSRRTA